MRQRRAWLVPVLLGSALSALAMSFWSGPVMAEEPVDASRPEATSPRIQDKLGWHTVRAGESLQTITALYLGTPHLWHENWKLNPDIRKPGLLRVGQRIRVLVERQLPTRRALIEEVANDVDKSRRRASWEDAEQGDQLEPKDGVRTRERSSTRLGFDDGSKLTLTEFSQVFLRDLETTLTGVRRGTIEVRKGQAELQLEAPRPRLIDIEIVVGDSIARPRPGPSGSAQTRSRRAESGGAQLMVYGGSSRIEAGGAAVEVPRGMGTSVPEGGIPSPPEKLLPAPVTSSPARRARFDYANPRFEWLPVTGAVSYVVEVCQDQSCGRLVQRATGLSEPKWHPERLPVSELFWRVTAVSASGLDGYPSRVASLAVLSGALDLEPPVVVAALEGLGQVVGDGTITLGRGAAIRLAGRDDASGISEIRYRWRPPGRETGEVRWQTYQDRVFGLPDGTSEATLEVEATDALGRGASIWQTRVRRDDSPPSAPVVSRAAAN